jgi:hypothetical protein
MSVLKQHPCDSGEIRNTHGTRPPTHLLSTNPIDAAFGARIDPYWCGKAHQSPSTTDSGRAEAGGPLGPHVAMHSDVAVATILILPTRATKGEYLQRTAEAAAGTLHPGDHDCGSAHHHQRGMGRH